MLFNSWSAVNHADLHPGRNVWRYHPFHPNNNTSGISGDPNGNGDGEETHALQAAAITLIQDAYVRKVIDTVNDLDNVIYEISGGDSSGDPSWQYHMINIIKDYEAGKPKQHPIGMTSGSNSALLSQPGNWMSMAGVDYDNPADPYANNPPTADGTRVNLLDTDHIGYMMFRDDAAFSRAWVWKSFLRGHHTLMMEDLGSNPGWISGRAAMGHTRTYATRMNLGSMTPQSNLSSTGYCLAHIGNEYLVYQGGSGAFSVNLAGNSYAYEWFNPNTGAIATTGTVGASGGSQTFTPPFQGPAVLYLKVSGLAPSSPPSSEGTATAAVSYQASANFSGIQGQGGWYYQDSQGRLMTYNASGGYWQGAETYLRLWNSSAHPGSAADAVRRWVAPSAGTVRITGKVADGDVSGGGGITALIRLGSTVLWQQAVANGNTAGVTFDVTTAVSAGTAIDFVINRGADGTNANDTTNFNPLITYVGAASTPAAAESPSPVAPASPPETATSYGASANFSGIQGQGGWYYQDSQGRLMTYNASGGYWQGAETYLRLWNSSAHPGSAADAVRRWVAPSAGTVRITGKVADGDVSGGGGITALIRLGSTVLWQQAVANGNTAGVTFDVTTAVSAGTAIDFVINRGADGTNANDTTNFNPLITYVGAASAPPPSGYTVTLSWTANSEPDLSGYRVYQRAASGTYGTPISIGKVTTHVATNLVSGTRYYFRLTSVDTSGNESVPSAEVTILK
ncbi:MAG: hypothetical protein GDA67_05840 [Nitrospira sp. CR1.3]|nr:hypothetical protein [Nitrospira sp. CR1.3]